MPFVLSFPVAKTLVHVDVTCGDIKNKGVRL